MPQLAIQLHRNSNGPAGAPPGAAKETIPAVFDEMLGESQWFRWHGLKIHYKTAGAGPPVVLVHSVDVGSSCVEWRRNIEPLSASFKVYAVDLPGFGRSEVPEESLRAELYLRFLQDFVQYASDQFASHHAVRIVASGGGAAYAATLARRHPSLVDRLVLISPTGLSVCHPNPLGPIAFRALGLPLVSAVPASTSSRSGILEHLQHDVYGDDLRASMNEVDARYWVSHRPGASKVERARLASLLNVNLRSVIGHFRQPVLLAWGRRAKCPPVDEVDTWKEQHERTLPCIFEQSGLCPHLEESTKFNEAALDFLSRDMTVVPEAA
jgi:pimeloyl-ACP methyl ester carboxylesterase